MIPVFASSPNKNSTATDNIFKAIVNASPILANSLLGFFELSSTPLDSYGSIFAKSLLCPSRLFAPLSTSSSQVIRAQTAQNPHCPLDIFLDFLSDTSPYVQRKALENPLCPSDILQKFYQKMENFINHAIAKNPSCPQNLLKIFLASRSPSLVASAAANPSCPQDAFVVLSSHPNETVRNAIASNPLCPTALLEKLSNDPHPDVRRGVAQNPATPLLLLHKIANANRQLDPSNSFLFVTLSIVRNPNCPPEILEKSILDPSSHYEVVKSSLRHPNVPQVLLEKYSQHYAYSFYAEDIRASKFRFLLNKHQQFIENLSLPHFTLFIYLINTPSLSAEQVFQLLEISNPLSPALKLPQE